MNKTEDDELDAKELSEEEIRQVAGKSKVDNDGITRSDR